MGGRLTLTAAYATFLKQRERPGDLVAALRLAGHGLEAELLMDWTGSGVRATETTDGRRAWVGPTLPSSPQPGDIWLDVSSCSYRIKIRYGFTGALDPSRARRSPRPERGP